MEPETKGKDALRLMFVLHMSADLLAVSSGAPVRPAIESAVTQAVAEVIRILGIPAEPVVKIEALEGALPGGRFFRLFLGDRNLRYSDELVQAVYCAVIGKFFRRDITFDDMLVRLAGDGASRGSERELVAEFFAELCAEIVKAQPFFLLGEAQFAAYRESLPAPAGDEPRPWPPDSAWLNPILTQLLSLKISIADKEQVSSVLAENVGQSWPDACEVLIHALRPPAIEIHATEDHLRRLTSSDPSARVGLLEFLRDGLFQESGAIYPQFRLVLDERLSPRQFFFTINHLASTRQVGLGPDECLVNDIPERMTKYGIPAAPAGNPATGQTNSVISIDKKAQAEQLGLTTWDEMGYFILSLAAVLRRHNHCFIDRGYTTEFLDRASGGFPALVKIAGASFSIERITAVLRNLAAEELSIRNSRVILEALIDFHLRHDRAEHSGDGAEPDRDPGGALAELTRFVRTCMADHVSAKFARDTSTVVVYLLEPKVQKLLSEHKLSGPYPVFYSYLPEDSVDGILEGLRLEVAALPAHTQVPSLLASGSARLALRKAIAMQFPRMQVVGFDELTPEVNIMPVARLQSVTETAAEPSEAHARQ